MRAQKPMPLGEKRKQGVKRRLEPTLRPHSCGDALQGFHVRDGIHQTGRRLFRHTNQKRDRPRGRFKSLCAIGCINAKRKTEQSALLIHKKGIRRIPRRVRAYGLMPRERGKGALAPLYRKHASGPFQQTAKTAATRRGFRARARRP